MNTCIHETERDHIALASQQVSSHKEEDKGNVNAAGHGVSLGSYEYLVYEKVFVAVAAEFGLQPVTDYVSDAEGFQKQYHEHRPLQDLLEQVSCPKLAA